jgi:cell division septum initiation protein DivIVA
MSSDRVQEIAQERGRTNESLRTEREKADQAVAAKQENVARHADAVVGRARDNADTVLSVARENADAVLDAARDRADQTADPGVVPSVERRVVEERILATKSSAVNATSPTRPLAWSVKNMPVP